MTEESTRDSDSLPHEISELLSGFRSARRKVQSCILNIQSLSSTSNVSAVDESIHNLVETVNQLNNALGDTYQSDIRPALHSSAIAVAMCDDISRVVIHTANEVDALSHISTDGDQPFSPKHVTDYESEHKKGVVNEKLTSVYSSCLDKDMKGEQEPEAGQHWLPYHLAKATPLQLHKKFTLLNKKIDSVKAEIRACQRRFQDKKAMAINHCSSSSRSSVISNSGGSNVTTSEPAAKHNRSPFQRVPPQLGTAGELTALQQPRVDELLDSIGARFTDLNRLVRFLTEEVEGIEEQFGVTSKEAAMTARRRVAAERTTAAAAAAAFSSAVDYVRGSANSDEQKYLDRFESDHSHNHSHGYPAFNKTLSAPFGRRSSSSYSIDENDDCSRSDQSQLLLHMGGRVSTGPHSSSHRLRSQVVNVGSAVPFALDDDLAAESSNMRFTSAGSGASTDTGACSGVSVGFSAMTDADTNDNIALPSGCDGNQHHHLEGDYDAEKSGEQEEYIGPTEFSSPTVLERAGIHSPYLPCRQLQFWRRLKGRSVSKRRPVYSFALLENAAAEADDDDEDAEQNFRSATIRSSIDGNNLTHGAGVALRHHTTGVGRALAALHTSTVPSGALADLQACWRKTASQYREIRGRVKLSGADSPSSYTSRLQVPVRGDVRRDALDSDVISSSVDAVRFGFMQCALASPLTAATDAEATDAGATYAGTAALASPSASASVASCMSWKVAERSPGDWRHVRPFVEQTRRVHTSLRYGNSCDDSSDSGPNKYLDTRRSVVQSAQLVDAIRNYTPVLPEVLKSIDHHTNRLRAAHSVAQSAQVALQANEKTDQSQSTSSTTYSKQSLGIKTIASARTEPEGIAPREHPAESRLHGKDNGGVTTIGFGVPMPSTSSAVSGNHSGTGPSYSSPGTSSGSSATASGASIEGGRQPQSVNDLRAVTRGRRSGSVTESPSRGSTRQHNDDNDDSETRKSGTSAISVPGSQKVPKPTASQIEQGQEQNLSQSQQAGLDEVERKVRAIYNTHNPAKLGEVPQQLEKYRGRELQLLANLEKKYGPAPILTPSTTAAGTGGSFGVKTGTTPTPFSSANESTTLSVSAAAGTESKAGGEGAGLGSMGSLFGNVLKTSSVRPRG